MTYNSIVCMYWYTEMIATTMQRKHNVKLAVHCLRRCITWTQWGGYVLECSCWRSVDWSPTSEDAGWSFFCVSLVQPNIFMEVEYIFVNYYETSHILNVLR